MKGGGGLFVFVVIVAALGFLVGYGLVSALT
jgi:hypothetical protein